MIRFFCLVIFVFSALFMLAGNESVYFTRYAVLCGGSTLIYFGASVNNMASAMREATLTTQEALGLDEDED